MFEKQMQIARRGLPYLRNRSETFETDEEYLRKKANRSKGLRVFEKQEQAGSKRTRALEKTHTKRIRVFEKQEQSARERGYSRKYRRNTSKPLEMD